MRYAVVVHQPGLTMADYNKVLDVLGPEPPAGRLVHAVGPTDNGLRFVDIWESRDAARRFEQERLFPAFGQVFGGSMTQPELADFDVEDYAAV